MGLRSRAWPCRSASCSRGGVLYRRAHLSYPGFRVVPCSVNAIPIRDKVRFGTCDTSYGPRPSFVPSRVRALVARPTTNLPLRTPAALRAVVLRAAARPATEESQHPAAPAAPVDRSRPRAESAREVARNPAVHRVPAVSPAPEGSRRVAAQGRAEHPHRAESPERVAARRPLPGRARVAAQPPSRKAAIRHSM